MQNHSRRLGTAAAVGAYDWKFAFAEAVKLTLIGLTFWLLLVALFPLS
jgi:hypothetical protein